MHVVYLEVLRICLYFLICVPCKDSARAEEIKLLMEDIELFVGLEGGIHVSSQLQQLENSFDRYSALSTPSYQTDTFKQVNRIICVDHARTLVFDSFIFISKGDIDIC